MKFEHLWEGHCVLCRLLVPMAAAEAAASLVVIWSGTSEVCSVFISSALGGWVLAWTS